MQTAFSLVQLADPDIARSEQILRKCVHCGFCTATCPTFVLLGDERDSPRGRIYLIKEMLEKNMAATRQVARHIDRCLSCLSCMTTCPSGVNYMHLVDHGRAHVERTYRRAPGDRLLRGLLRHLMPRPNLLRWAMLLAQPTKLLLPLLPDRSTDPGGATFLRRLRALLEAVPSNLSPPSPADSPQTFPAVGSRRQRVILMNGCGQQVLAPEVNEATIRLLTRHGVEVVVSEGQGCCGSSVLHVGDAQAARELARRNIAAWQEEIRRGEIDAIVVNASGCGTTLKDYGHLLADDRQWREAAQRMAGLACDISELMQRLGLNPVDLPRRQDGRPLTVAYHAACSAQHGQKLLEVPKALIRATGVRVMEPAEGHLCCGWAGTYQVLQPELSRRLRDRKAANIAALQPDIVVAGNFGCIGNIAPAIAVPVVHSAEFLDWATGGPPPAALRGRTPTLAD